MNSWLSWRYLIPSYITVTVITSLFACCQLANGQDQIQLRETWRKKVPQERKQFFDHLKSRKTKSYTSSTESKVLIEGKLQVFRTQQVVKRNGSFWLLNAEGDAGDPLNTNSNRCYGINSKYAFMLKKSKNGKEWVIQNVTPITPDVDEKTLFGMKFNVAGGNSESGGLRALVNAMFDLFDQRSYSVSLLQGIRAAPSTNDRIVEIAEERLVELGKLEQLPEYRLNSLTIDGPRQNLLQVNFGYNILDTKGEKTAVANCQIDFDLEAKCYPIRSHQVVNKETEDIIVDSSETLIQKSENEYEKKSLRSFSRRKKNSIDTGARLFEEIKEETVFSLNDIPERDFTLSAFGLPEPPGIEWSKPFPWYLVFAGIGTACLGVFFFLRSRAKRLKA